MVTVLLGGVTAVCASVFVEAGFAAVPQDGAAGATSVAASRGPVACTFDIECDDGDPCTHQRCDIEPGDAIAMGECVYTAVAPGEPGDCDDGQFCNGLELCDTSGECQSGAPATCCANPAPPAPADYCTATLGYCDQASVDPGSRCSSHGDCGGASRCLHCVPICATHADCDDGLACNGIESCAAGECLAGVPLCGLGGVCSEKRCKNAQGQNQQPPTACDSDGSCTGGYSCQPDPLCFLGRCCSEESEPVCTNKRLSQPPPNSTCLAGGGNWYAGDFGRETGEFGTCGGVNPNVLGVPLGCPKYGSGIAQDSPAPPVHPVTAGPVSASPVAIVPPEGPGASLHRMGDDYELSNGSHLELLAIRFVGAMSDDGALVFELWDGNGHLVEDFTAAVQAGSGVRIAYVDSPFVIPPSGFVTASVAASVNPNAKFTWISADSVTIGENDAGKLFVNDDPNAANFLSPAPGILSFELLGGKAAEPLGACCQADGSCVLQTKWLCEGEGNHFQGVGSACPHSACDLGACCEAQTGQCDESTEADCVTPDAFLGLGSACEPNCCPQPAADTDCSDGACFTGADQINDAFVHVLPNLDFGDPPYVVTITGDNTYGTAASDDPDFCYGVAETPADDAGWYESIGFLGSCMRLRIDFCCSEPDREFDQVLLYHEFDCERPILPAPDPYRYGEPAQGHGSPYCDGDNYWATYGLLGPDHYSVSIPSPLWGPRGPYQLHLTAEACPDAACCMPDGSCEDGVNQLECDALGGIFLAPPQRFPAVDNCSADPCATGSCCVGPGICVDEIDGVPTDFEDCQSLGASYKGGLRCEGGFCADDPDYSCNDAGDCATFNDGPGGLCNSGPGGAQALAQPNPCPTCEWESESTCNLWDDPSGFSGSISELGLGSGQITADDFIAGPGLTRLEEVCVWGFYHFTDPDAAGLDCHGQVTSDSFRVRILRTTFEGLPDSSPSGIVGTSTTTILGRAIIPGARSLQVGDGYETFAYQLSLNTAISGLNPGTRYWIEIANNLDSGDGCFWIWSQISDDSLQGNNFSAGGSGGTGYVIGSQKADDMAFCLSGPFETPPEPQRPCCTCSGNCVITTLDVCNNLLGNFQITEHSCAGLCPSFNVTPANDDCANATSVPVGTHYPSILCAETDGINPVDGEGGLFPLGFDVWYEFHAAQDCTLRLDMCATGDNFDSAIALYSNGTDACVCPTSQAVADATFLVAGDENCAAGGAGGAPFVDWPATAGQCFIIRVGNWATGGTRGTGILDISCGPPFCGDGTAQPSNGEECDGADAQFCDYGCNPPGHPQECECAPVPVCGNGVREGSEQCDPGNPSAAADDTVCPGLCIENCTCSTICGNSFREPTEECDGPDDTSCGGVAGRCLSDCTCPPVFCGNGFMDEGEECDPGAGGNADGDEDDSLCAGECRLPADPVGGCTCQCGPCFVATPVQPAVSEPNKPRFLSIIVPEPSPGPGVPETTAIRVTLQKLNRPRFCCTDPSATSCSTTPCDSNAQCGAGGFPQCVHGQPAGAPDYSCYEGDVRYVNSFGFPAIVGGSLDCGDEITTSYKCATLGCEPEFRNWAADLASPGPNQPQIPGLLFVTGDVVLPSSSYVVDHLAGALAGTYANVERSRMPNGKSRMANGRTGLLAPQASIAMLDSAFGVLAASVSCPTPEPLTVTTSRWGDVSGVANGPPDGRADVLDIPAIVNKLLGLSNAFSEPRLWLKQTDPAPHVDGINVLDLSDCVNGVKEIPYACTRKALHACPQDGHADVCSPDPCP